MAAGIAGELYALRIKVNSGERGFNQKYWLRGTDRAVILTKAVDLCGRLRVILPTDAEIFYATLSNDNHQRDSQYLKDAIGAGTYNDPGSPATPAKYDFPSTALEIRLENDNFTSVTRKINPIPDKVLVDATPQAAIVDVTAVPTPPLAAVGSGADWYANFTLFMAALVLNTIHVVAAHAPGGVFTYYNWQKCYVLRAGTKKGGRVFSS